MPKQVLKKNKRKKIDYCGKTKKGLLVLKTQSMKKTSLNSYAVLLKNSLDFFLFFTEHCKINLKPRYVYICISSAFVCSSSMETILYHWT